MRYLTWFHERNNHPVLSHVKIQMGGSLEDSFANQLDLNEYISCYKDESYVLVVCPKASLFSIHTSVDFTTRDALQAFLEVSYRLENHDSKQALMNAKEAVNDFYSKLVLSEWTTDHVYFADKGYEYHVTRE